MLRTFKALFNSFKIPDLRQRILFTLGMIAGYAGSVTNMIMVTETGFLTENSVIAFNIFSVELIFTAGPLLWIRL